MTTKIQKWGNSQGIRLPKYLLDAVHWSDEDRLEVRVENNKLIIEKEEPRKNIRELFAGFEGGYERTDIDWGEPAGEEVW